jgi:hypothetical protein
MYGHGEGLFHAPYTWPKKEKAQPPNFFFYKRNSSGKHVVHLSFFIFLNVWMACCLISRAT